MVVELLLQTPAAGAIADRVFGGSEPLHAPHLLDVEVAHVIRRYWLAKDLNDDRAGAALEEFSRFRIERHRHDLLVPRIWELRHNLTACDSAYIALAEALGGPLLTRDTRLKSAPGHHAFVELV